MSLWDSTRSTWRAKASLSPLSREAAEQVLATLRAHPLDRSAVIIGEVVAEQPGKVYVRSRIGGLRVVDYAER